MEFQKGVSDFDIWTELKIPLPLFCSFASKQHNTRQRNHLKLDKEYYYYYTAVNTNLGWRERGWISCRALSKQRKRGPDAAKQEKGEWKRAKQFSLSFRCRHPSILLILLLRLLGFRGTDSLHAQRRANFHKGKKGRRSTEKNGLAGMALLADESAETDCSSVRAPRTEALDTFVVLTAVKMMVSCPGRSRKSKSVFSSLFVQFTSN